MSGINSYLQTVFNGYHRLAVTLVRLFSAAALLALLAALIALPLWYLAIHASRLFTLLLSAGLLVWVIIRRLPPLILRSRAMRQTASSSGRPRSGAVTIQKLVLILCFLLTLYLGIGSLLQGFLITGIPFTLLGLILLGIMIRTPA